MKKILSVAILATLCFSLISCGGKTTFKDNEDFSKGEIDSVSHAIGALLSANISPQQIGELNYDLLLKTMSKMLTDTTYATTTEVSFPELQAVVQGFFLKKQAAQIRKESSKFLEENKTQEGVITLPSGLQYKILEQGSGIKPTADNTVEVHYTGSLWMGQTFDSSRGGEPAKFALTGVIPGWTEGFQHLSEGTKAILYIPSELGYGEEGSADGRIPGNAALVFEVELIKVH